MITCLTNVSDTDKQKWHQEGFKFNIKKWLGGTGWPPGAPQIPQITTLQAVHTTVHHGMDKMIQIIKQYWWSHCSKMVQNIYNQCLTCQSCSPGKYTEVAPGTAPPHLGHLNIFSGTLSICLLLRAINMSLTICMSSRWARASPCWKTDATTVAKTLLENILPLWGIPNLISSDKGIHFTGQVRKQLKKGYSNIMVPLLSLS